MKKRKKILLSAGLILGGVALLSWGIASTVLLVQKDKTKEIIIDKNTTNNTSNLDLSTTDSDLVYESGKWITNGISVKNVANTETVSWYEVSKNKDGSYSLGTLINTGTTLNFSVTTPNTDTYYFVASIVSNNSFIFSNIVSVLALQQTIGATLTSYATSYANTSYGFYFTKPDSNSSYNLTLSYNNEFNNLSLPSGDKLMSYLYIPQNGNTNSYTKILQPIKNNQATFNLTSSALNTITNNWSAGGFTSFMGQFFLIENSLNQIVAMTSFNVNLEANFDTSFANQFILSNSVSNNQLTITYNTNIMTNIGKATWNYSLTNTSNDVLASGNLNLGGSNNTITANITNNDKTLTLKSTFNSNNIIYFSNDYTNGTSTWTINNTININ